ncbi:MAG: tryptophan--tRNA ligase, partial [Armatimonadota bacterium]
YDNCVYLSDSPDNVREKVGTMFTDPVKIRKDDPGHPDECPVYAYHLAYSPETAPQIKEDCEAGRLGCVPHKQQLAGILIEALGPFWERRAALAADPDRVEAALQEGARRAREKTSQTMDLVWRAIKLR